MKHYFYQIGTTWIPCPPPQSHTPWYLSPPPSTPPYTVSHHFNIHSWCIFHPTPPHHILISSSCTVVLVWAGERNYGNQDGLPLGLCVLLHCCACVCRWKQLWNLDSMPMAASCVYMLLGGAGFVPPSSSSPSWDCLVHPGANPFVVGPLAWLCPGMYSPIVCPEWLGGG